MKYIYSALMTAAFFGGALVLTANSASAQGRYCDNNGRQARYERRDDRRYREAAYNRSGYYNDGRYNDGYYYGRRPSFYQRNRKVINVAVSTGAGAAVGAIVGGKKGALIGAGAGAVTGLIINAKQKPRY